MQPARSGPLYAGPPTSTTSRYKDYEEPSSSQAQMHHDQRQRNDYRDDHLYFSQHQQQNPTQSYTLRNNAGSSSSDSEYFSYSSDASLAPIAGSSTYNGYRSFEPLNSSAPGPSSPSSSIPFQTTAPAQVSLDVEDLFGFADVESRATTHTLEASATEIGDKQDGAKSRANTSAAAGGGHASDSSLSSEVASNPLLRQDLHKNGTPKRPLNSFMIFSRWRRPQLQKEKPEIKASDLSKLLAIEWANLPHAEKKRFLDDAKVVKANFHIMHPEYVYSRRPNGAKRSKAKRSSTPSSAGSSVEGGSTSKPIRSGARRAGSKAPLNSSTNSRPDSESARSPTAAGGGYSSSASSTCSSFFPPIPSVFDTPSRVQTPAFPPPSTAASNASSAFGHLEPIQTRSRESPSPSMPGPSQAHSGEALNAAHMLANMDLQRSQSASALSSARLPPAPRPASTPLAPLVAPRPMPSAFTPAPALLEFEQVSAQENFTLMESPLDFEPQHRAPAQQPQHTLYSSSGSSSLSSSTGSAYSTYAQPAPAARFPAQQAFEQYSPQIRYRATSPPPAPLSSTIDAGPSIPTKTDQHFYDKRAGWPARQPPLSISTALDSSTSSSASSAEAAPNALQHQLAVMPWSSIAHPAPISSPSMLALSSTKIKRKPPVAGISRMNRRRNGSNGSSISISSSDDSNASSAFWASVVSSQQSSRRTTIDDPYLLPRITTTLAQSRSTYPSSMPGGTSPAPIMAEPVQPVQPTSLPSLSSMRLPGLNGAVGHPRAQQQPARSPPATSAWSGSQSVPASATYYQGYTAVDPPGHPGYTSNPQDTSLSYNQTYVEKHSEQNYTLYHPMPEARQNLTFVRYADDGQGGIDQNAGYYDSYQHEN